MSKPLSQPRPRWVGPSDFAKWSSRRRRRPSTSTRTSIQPAFRRVTGGSWEKSSGMHGVGELTCARPEEH